MSHPSAESMSAAPPHADVLGERMRRYLPLDMAEDLLDTPASDASADRHMLAAFAHLAAARYTITTYLPRLLTQRLLHERLETPWLRWVAGSLLFADLSGSTALAERLSALGREGTELVTEALNELFALMIEVIQTHGGDLVAFGGDALLVFFGDERHARTATRAALALQRAIAGYVRHVPGIGSFPMHLHIGVESGRVAFVSAGLPHARYYSVLGTTVNGVAAAEGQAAPGEVVVGAQAWASLVGFATGEQVAPGFFRVSAMSPPRFPPPPLAEVLPPLADPQRAIPYLLDDLDLLSPYIAPVLLERILSDPQRPRIEADLRPVTVLFAQTVGFEDVADTLPPDQVARAVQRWIVAMQRAVEQFGGVVNKLDVADEGIKLVAIFGAPTAYEDHAERAVRAALQMQRQEDQEPGREEDEQSEALNATSLLRQRIGLNTGTAFAGNVGSAARKEYTVMGDAVNVAARVMSKAAWGEVWCSEATTQAVGERIVCEPRGAMALKGKAHPLPLFLVAEERDTPDVEQSDEGPLVGRERELAWLREHLRAARDGRGRTVRLIGDAGVGKSRLTAALVEQARADGVQVIHAACLPYSASIPYAAWGEWLKAYCLIVSGDDDAVRARKLADRLLEIGDGMDEWLPLLGDLVRLDVPENRLTRGLDPQMRQTRRFELLEQLLQRAACGAPLLVLFEDLHWADPISLDLWRRVTATIGEQAILLLGVHRPGLEAGDDGAHLLELRELSAEESAQMALLLAGAADLPAPVLSQIVARAGGNPLFLAELIRAVLTSDDQRPTTTDQDSLRSTDGSSVAGRRSAVVSLDELPDSLNGLLLARIDRLDETSRSVLRVASVIGQRIPFGVLRSIQATDQQTLTRQLARLDAQQITVIERLEPERVHTFRHALLQEVAYQSMLYARRRELHGRIGEYLERRYGDDLDDYYGLLAHHYRLSDRHAKAIIYLLKAGHAARDVYANEEAEQYYVWALQALEGDDGNARAWEVRDALGDVYTTVGRYDEALTQHAAIIAAPGVLPDNVRRAHRKRGSILEKQGQYSAAMEALDRAMNIARSDAPGISPLALPVISADIGLVHQRRGEYDLAIAACAQGLAALRRDARTHEDERIEARLHSTLGGIYGMRGDYPRARHHFERSLGLRELIDDLPGVIISNNNLGYLWQLQGEYAQALEHYRVAEELARKINLRYFLVFAAGNAAYSLVGLGVYEEAEARCQEALAISHELQAQHSIAQAHDIFGLIAYHRGNYEEATAAYNRALVIHRKLGSRPQEGSTLANMAFALNAQGQFAAAWQVAQEAMQHALALDSQRLKVESHNALAEAAIGRADSATGRAHAAEATALGRSMSSTFDLGIALRLLGVAARAGAQPFDESFVESSAIFQKIGDQFELGRTWAAYGAALITSGNQIDGAAYLKQAQAAFVSVGAKGELERLATLERSV